MFSEAPFHSTRSPTTKLVPIADNVNPELPEIADAGESELSTGGGGGAGAARFKVTVTTAGEPCAPAAVTVMCPRYVFALSPAMVAETCKLCGAVPLTGETESQAASVEAVKFRAPVPVLVTFTVEGDGFVPP